MDNYNFDYKNFLIENKFTQVSKKRSLLKEELDENNKQKEDYLNRQNRLRRGNWKGSIGDFVDKHGQELSRVADNRQALVSYIQNTMKPAVDDEAKEKLDDFISKSNSSIRLLQALYNCTLKGSGLGLHEDCGK